MGLGSDLRQARESRKISLETVSQKTRIPVKYLEALESEEYGVFPSQTHARGFARAYAKVVGLDPSALTAQFKAEVKPVEVKINPPNAEAEIPSGFSIPFLKKKGPAGRRERLRDEDFDPEVAAAPEGQAV
ncbi:MAG TPA: helix-turn-helix transcriptional regulator, partial [bacterium]|nr:helix-turn-helix transcriptional regulator [bacterium]